jgi:hypothetical protein
MKVLIMDSGVLINLSLNGLLNLIPELKKATGVRFAITGDVKFETVDRPVGVPRFEFGALQVLEMMKNKDIEMPEDFGVSKQELEVLRDKILQSANHVLRSKNQWIQIVSNAEISCLALSQILSEKGVENMIGIDERTTRLLAEKPENLEAIISSKIHQRIQLERKNLFDFKNFRFIRSSELVYVAFKKGLLKMSDSRTLEAALFATKYKGSSISFDEIKELKKL